MFHMPKEMRKHNAVTLYVTMAVTTHLGIVHTQIPIRHRSMLERNKAS